MKLNRLYFFYSVLFFFISSPVFVFLYVIKIFTERRYANKDHVIKYIKDLISKGDRVFCEKIYGGFNNCLVKISIGGFSDRKTVVLKKYSCFGSFFTLWGGWFTPYGNYRKISSYSRFANEVFYNRLMERSGINTPKILAVNDKDNVLIMDFIDGDKMDQIMLSDKLLYNMGNLVAKIHSLGVFMNDNTPCNFILKNERIYVVDLEGFSFKGDRALDLATFVFWVQNNRGNVKKFMEGYEKALEIIGNNVKKIEQKELKEMLSAVASYRPIFSLGSYLRGIV